jgi:hypothetical protein
MSLGRKLAEQLNKRTDGAQVIASSRMVFPVSRRPSRCGLDKATAVIGGGLAS